MEQSKDNFNVKDGWDFNGKDSYVVNFKGMKYNKCTPTVLDWVLEIKNKVLILAEVKRSEKTGDLPNGQRILAENLCSYIKLETIPVYYLYVKGLVIDGQVFHSKFKSYLEWYEFYHEVKDETASDNYGDWKE
jgi:hypothetical protein